MFKINVIVEPNFLEKSGISQKYYSQVLGTFSQAYELWSRYIHGNDATLNIKLDIFNFENSRALASASATTFIDEDGVSNLDAINILDGEEARNELAGSINLNKLYTDNNLYKFVNDVDNIEPGTGLQAYSMLVTLVHEIGHIIGFHPTTISPLLNEENLFEGMNTTIANGGVPVEFIDDAHLLIEDDLLGQNINLYQRQTLSPVDIAVLEDIGLNVVKPTTEDDILFGFHNSDDSIFAGKGDDVINGLSGNDILSGGEGNDQITGMAGNDYIVGGKDSDLLAGGEGYDIFSFDAVHFEAGIFDVVIDFSQMAAGFDHLGFTNLAESDLIIADFQGDKYITTSELNFSGGIQIKNAAAMDISGDLLFF
jgi:hypothetical protein